MDAIADDLLHWLSELRRFRFLGELHWTASLDQEPSIHFLSVRGTDKLRFGYEDLGEFVAGPDVQHGVGYIF
jgi:hypothetical protein